MKARRLIALCPLLLLACGCRIEPPLHLRQTLDLEIELALDLDVDLIWQADWENRWTFAWDPQVHGELAYEAPRSVRMHSYARNADGLISSMQVYNFMGTSGSIRAVAGTYDFLFYNNDSEALLFDTESSSYDVYAYTRTISSGLKLSTPVKTLGQKQTGTKGDAELEAEDDPVVLQPEGLFSSFTPERFISDDPADYELVDGRYVVHMEGTLHPSDFIWLVQVRLLNNAGRVIGSAGGCALTGMAEGVDLKTGISGTKNVTVPSDLLMDRSVDPDQLGARIVSFGIPGCDAYDPQSVAAAPAGKHFLVLSIFYNNGTYNNIHVDVTDQVRALPTGGVISLELDVDDFPPEHGQQGPGGFEALLEGWEEHTGNIDIIY
ncbi:MAG: DUF5119 domain-containing protein [Bacteroidales bacterium]|nr:DUF5119 domain-containing protein [Bacteroidales bacterium]